MAPETDLRRTQAEWDDEADHTTVRGLRHIARRDPVLAAMIAEDLRWMPLVIIAALVLAPIALALAA